MFLLTASNPSLGAIIGLAHTLAPSTPGRYGGHLHQLSPWGICLSLCFHGFQEQLLAVKTPNGIIETNDDGELQNKVRFLFFSLMSDATVFTFIYILMPRIVFLNVLSTTFTVSHWHNFGLHK